MSEEFTPSDAVILDYLRERDSTTVAELADALQVTATAVRQRLVRLLSQAMSKRSSARARTMDGTSHRYILTLRGDARLASTFQICNCDLERNPRAWKIARYRGRLIAGISRRFAGHVRQRRSGESLAEKMQSLAGFFGERRIPLAVEAADAGPNLRSWHVLTRT